MSLEDDGVILSDGRCSSVLHAIAGSVGADHFEHRVDVVAGPLRGSFTASVYYNGYRSFRDDLVRLYDTLAGEARLEGYENLDLVLTGDGRAHVDVEVIATVDHLLPIRLAFRICLDQTPLRKIVAAIERMFIPAPGMESGAGAP